MSTIAIDNFKPSAGGTSFGIEGIAKARLEYDQITPTVDYSENVSSITDDATGDFTVNFTNNFSDTLYGPYGGTLAFDGSNRFGSMVGPDNSSDADERTTSSLKLHSRVGADATSNSQGTDRNMNLCVFFGDLA